MFPPPSDQIGPRPPRTKLEHFQRAKQIVKPFSWNIFKFESVLDMDQQVGLRKYLQKSQSVSKD